MENKTEKNSEATFYEVDGAGKILISTKNEYRTGDITGFRFGVEWGKFGFTGGVLSNEVAEKLANHILKTLKK